ncbi:MAG TPA: hypothetical protein VK638_24255, partial [Edaphobacter sp.]|nr:hypothetical protein [Edaphobacter sp.]
HHQFYFSQAHGEIKVQPHALGNDLFRKSVTAIWIAWHSTRITPLRRENANLKDLPFAGTEAEVLRAAFRPSQLIPDRLRSHEIIRLRRGAN